MLGKPKFTYGDIVRFKVDDEELIGKIEIIDAYGTFFQNEDVSYDIMVEHSVHFNGAPCLYKHIIESNVSYANQQRSFEEER